MISIYSCTFTFWAKMSFLLLFSLVAVTRGLECFWCVHVEGDWYENSWNGWPHTSTCVKGPFKDVKTMECPEIEFGSPDVYLNISCGTTTQKMKEDGQVKTITIRGCVDNFYLKNECNNDTAWRYWMPERDGDKVKFAPKTFEQSTETCKCLKDKCNDKRIISEEEEEEEDKNPGSASAQTARAIVSLCLVPFLVIIHSILEC